MARAAKAERLEKNLSGSAERIASNVSMVSADDTGVPSTNTTWHPTERFGAERAAVTASAKAEPLAINVVDDTTPSRWVSTMARLTPAVRPKSSALTINFRTLKV